MTPELPNCVGMMDEIVEAIRLGDLQRSSDLLRIELDRRTHNLEQRRLDFMREYERYKGVYDVHDVVSAIIIHDWNVGEECLNAWKAYQKACGGTPQ